MAKIITLLMAVAITAYAAEIPSHSLLEKHAMFNPELKAESMETHAVKKEMKPELERRPVYRAEDHKNEGRARIEPVKSLEAVMKHDMLADQPQAPTEVNRVDNMAAPGYGYVPAPAEVAYPDVAYAPGYSYDSGYPTSNSYDVYSNSLGSYLMEPETSMSGLLWSQVPDSRTIVSYVGRTISWVFGSISMLLLGAFLTVGLCSYTNLCTINFHGVGPIHEEMRSLISPERLEKISHAADFVKNAIDKYQKIQKVNVDDRARNRRSIYY